MEVYRSFFYVLYNLIKRFEKSTPEWGAILILSSLALVNFTSLILIVYKFIDLPLIPKTYFIIVIIFIFLIHQQIFISNKKYVKMNKKLKRSLDEKGRNKMIGYLIAYSVCSIVLLYVITINY